MCQQSVNRIAKHSIYIAVDAWPNHLIAAVRMGRLAVDQAFKGQGLGGPLLADALGRAARAEIATFAIMVDAKDDAASAFYQHHGFIALPDSPLTLFLPLVAVRPSK